MVVHSDLKGKFSKTKKSVDLMSYWRVPTILGELETDIVRKPDWTYALTSVTGAKKIQKRASVSGMPEITWTSITIPSF